MGGEGFQFLVGHCVLGVYLEIGKCGMFLNRAVGHKMRAVVKKLMKNIIVFDILT
jgi:hypothetical protein